MTWTSHFDICWPCCPDQKNHSVKRLQHQDRVALQKRFNIPQQKTLTSTSDLDPVQEQKFLIKDLIIALEISLLSSIPRGEETLNFKVSNFLPKKTEKDTFAWKWMFNFWKKKVRGTFSTTFHNLFCSGQTGGAGLAIFKWYADTFFFLAIYIWKYEKCMGWNIHTHSHTFCSTEN